MRHPGVDVWGEDGRRLRLCPKAQRAKEEVKHGRLLHGVGGDYMAGTVGWLD